MSRRNWEEWGMEDEYDMADPIQDELNHEANEMIKTFGSQIKEKQELSDSAQEVLKSFVAAHSTLSERKRAYDLALWILKKNKKGVEHAK